ncbi:MAG: hypothetical protein AAF570_23305, partial [Bacteroidota bacterium]
GDFITANGNALQLPDHVKGMKNFLSCLPTIFPRRKVKLGMLFCFCMLNGIAFSQTIFFQQFHRDPFKSLKTVKSDYPLNNKGCKQPSYIVDARFNSVCQELPSHTGNGYFMYIDNDANSSGIIYSQKDLGIQPGEFTLRMRLRHRYHREEAAWKPLKLGFFVNEIQVKEVKLDVSHAWGEYHIPVKIEEGGARAEFQIVQLNEGEGLYYGIDDIKLTRRRGLVEVPDLADACPCKVEELMIGRQIEAGWVSFTVDAELNECTTLDSVILHFGDGKSAVAHALPFTIRHQYAERKIYFPNASVAGKSETRRCHNSIKIEPIVQQTESERNRISAANAKNPKRILKVSQIPGKKSIEVMHNFPADQQMYYLLTDWRGKIIQKPKTGVDAGSPLQIDLPEDAEGVYRIALSSSYRNWLKTDKRYFEVK